MVHMRKTVLHAFLPATGLVQLAHAAGKAAQFPQGSQYIRFSGIVRAKVTWEKGIVPAGVDHTTQACSEDYASAPHPRSHLYVGVNPPWDTNPFFFELHHLVSDDCPGYFCKTSDTIMNLYFASASYECFSGGRLCTTFSRGDRYEPKVYLDLNPGRAQVQQTQVGGQAGYAVKGGPDTWIGDVDGNEVDVEADCQWVVGQGRGAHVGGYSWLNFVWNKTTPLDYDLTFSNQSAALTLTTKMVSPSLSRVVSAMTLSFEGARNDTQEEAKEKSFHDLNPIQLGTGNASVPEFRFANGSRIYFATGNQGWTAAATSLPQTTALSVVSRSSGRTSSTTVATAASSSRNAAPKRGPGSSGGVVTAVVVKVMVVAFGLI